MAHGPGRNKDIMARAVKIVTMFQDRREITTRDVAAELDISFQVARKWIDAASRVMPVCETGTRRVSQRGPEAIVFGLMK